MCRTTTTTKPSKCHGKPKTMKVQKKSNAAKKSVRFSAANQVTFRHVPKEELRQSWYQSEEYKGFHHDRILTIRSLRSAKGDLRVLDPNSQCVRGLEMQATPEIFKYRSQGIKTTIRSVLQHQHAQRQVGLKDPTSLGVVSMASSQRAQVLAKALALIDSQSL